MSARDVALTHVVTAQQWISRTVGALVNLDSARTTMTQPSQQRWANSPALAAVRRHFLLGDAAASNMGAIRAAVARIVPLYRRINGVLGWAQDVFRDGAGEGDEGAYTPSPRDGHIYFTPRYIDGCGPLTKVYVIVHEGAHFLGANFQDHLRDPPQTLDDALTDAYSFSDCVFEIVNGVRSRSDAD